MKRLVFVLVFLAQTVCFASPYLACDPASVDEEVLSSQVEFDAVWEPAVPAAGCTDKAVGCVWTDGNGVQNYILRDLSGITDGNHTTRARFINAWGEGEISDPFVFDKARPGKRSIRLIP